MADMLSTGVTGLLAFQQELATTSNNISNANTPGYSRETVSLSAVPGQYVGQISIGNGVTVSSVQRVYNQIVANQVVTATAGYNQLNTYATLSAQVDNLLGSTSNGLSTQLQSLVSAMQTVANTPTSSASRQALLSQAQSLVSALQSDDSTLQGYDSDANQQLSSAASQVTSLASSIAQLNVQIMAQTTPTTPAPSTLLDQRDQLVNQLSTYVSVSTTQQADGSENVYIGSGQPLVNGATAASLVTIPSTYDPSEVNLGLQSAAGLTDVTKQITGGSIGGTLQFRSQMLDPARNGLGQIAIVLANAVNTQNQSGLDQTGNLGQAVFSVGAVGVLPSTNNTGSANIAVTRTSPNSITADNYRLKFDGTNWSLSDLTTGGNVALSGNGTSSSPFTAAGMSFVVSGTAQAGDTYIVEPTSGAIGTMSVLLTNPNQIAAAAPLLTSAGSSNTGNATIDQGSVTSASGWVRGNYTLSFTSASAYQITDSGNNVVATGSYTSGSPINFNGMEVTVSGTPATGDTFSINDNASGTGDNRNATALANLLNQPLLGGTTSINGAVGQLITNIGIQTGQAQNGATAQQAVLTAATNNQQSVSGVNLDEEAANLVQYQQAYQAAAEVIKVATTLFQSLLSAVQA